MRVRTLVGRYAGEVRDIRPREALQMIKDGRAEPLTAPPQGGQFPIATTSPADDRELRVAIVEEVAEVTGIPANAARMNAGLPKFERTSILRRKRASE